MNFVLIHGLHQRFLTFFEPFPSTEIQHLAFPTNTGNTELVARSGLGNCPTNKITVAMQESETSDGASGASRQHPNL